MFAELSRVMSPSEFRGARFQRARNGSKGYVENVPHVTFLSILRDGYLPSPTDKPHLPVEDEACRIFMNQAVKN